MMLLFIMELLLQYKWLILIDIYIILPQIKCKT